MNVASICTYQTNGAPRVGVPVDGAIVGLEGFDSVKALLAAGVAGREAVARAEEAFRSGTATGGVPEGEAVLLPPVPDAGKCLCLAGNFRSHMLEGKTEEEQKALTFPETLHVFQKPPGVCLAGPFDDITVPTSMTMLDYELELALVIGRGGRHIPEEQAMDHLGGLCVANDLGDRAFMPENPSFLGIDWFSMKAFDGSVVCGPYLLLNDGMTDFSSLQMKLWVNGELRQQSDPTDMIIPIPRIISRISSRITLEPGDLILTGTPAGNGWNRGEFLKDGDVVEAWAEGSGTLRNRIRMVEPAYRSAGEA